MYNMTIIRGLSKAGDQEVPELSSNGMPATQLVGSVSRQKSFNLPDFTSLLDSLSTPTLKLGFDFACAPCDDLESEQLSLQNSESLSLYPESLNPAYAQLKNIQLVVPKEEPLSDHEDEVKSETTESDVMGIDNETENSHLAMEGGMFHVKSEAREEQRVNSEQQTVNELITKMDKCCKQLNIPKDPTQWTAQNVQQWAAWILRESYQGYNWDYMQIQRLQIDGTTLCMLGQEDFVYRIGSDLGDLLFIELDLWKNAFCIEVQTRQQQHNMEVAQQQQQLQQQQQQIQYRMYNNLDIQDSQLPPQQQQTSQLTYADISDSRPMCPPITQIPTPQFEMSPLTLNELNQPGPEVQMYHSSQQQEAYHQLSPAGSNLGSQGWGDESSESGCSQLGNEYYMEEEDSRASSPNNGSMQSFTPTVVRPVVSTPPKKYGAAPGHTKHTIHLWQFLRELLLAPNHYNNCIRWVDQRRGIFKIEDSARVARLWGQRKNRPAMNYDKLSRSIRQYYKKGIIKKTEQSKRLVYQFCEPYL